MITLFKGKICLQRKTKLKIQIRKILISVIINVGIAAVMGNISIKHQITMQHWVNQQNSQIIKYRVHRTYWNINRQWMIIPNKTNKISTASNMNQQENKRIHPFKDNHFVSIAMNGEPKVRNSIHNIVADLRREQRNLVWKMLIINHRSLWKVRNSIGRKCLW
jgi:coenzyme F420-reducing hydrogenase gamma subunit